MPINKDLLAKKLDFLHEQIEKIENMNFGADDLCENADIQDLLTFRLQQSVETCIDIATHLIAGLSLPRKETAKDALLLLGQEKIIDKELSVKLGMATDFRNRVVHGYNNFDYSLLYKDYKDNLADLINFGAQILKFIERSL